MIEQVKSSGCAASTLHEEQVRREGADPSLRPACSTLSDCTLCRSAFRRAGPSDHHHEHGQLGHRSRHLRASRRHRGRLFVDLPAARNSTAVLMAPLWRMRDGVVAQRHSVCGRCTQLAPVGDRHAYGRAERRGIDAYPCICSTCSIQKHVRVTGAVYPSAAGPCGDLSLFWTL